MDQEFKISDTTSLFWNLPALADGTPFHVKATYKYSRQSWSFVSLVKRLKQRL